MGSGGGGASGNKHYIFVIAVASLLELWFAATICDRYNTDFSDCKDDPAWAVACGTISLVFMIVLLLLGQFCGGQADGVPGKILVFLTWVVWICGVAVYTFGESSKSGWGAGQSSANNGWFGTWVCFIVSTLLVFEVITEIADLAKKAVGPMDDAKKYLAIVGGASLVEMWHAAKICDNHNTAHTDCRKMPAWAVAVGAIGLFICLLVGIVGNFVAVLQGDMAKKISSAVLAVLWFLGTITLTMPYKDEWVPFVGVGNGWCGCWIAMLGSLAFAGHTFGAGNALDKANMGGGGDSGGSGGGSPATVPPATGQTQKDPETGKPQVEL